MIKIQNPKQLNKGFTLVELLVVIAIIALLISIVLVTVPQFKAKGRDSRRVIDMQEITNALNMYHNNNQTYPIYTGYIEGTDSFSQALIADNTMSAVPRDPLNALVNGILYKYAYQSEDGKSFIVSFCLETNSIKGRNQGCNNQITP